MSGTAMESRSSHTTKSRWKKLRNDLYYDWAYQYALCMHAHISSHPGRYACDIRVNIPNVDLRIHSGSHKTLEGAKMFIESNVDPIFELAQMMYGKKISRHSSYRELTK